MSERAPDIVAELDRWLAAIGGMGTATLSATFLRRSRDEMVTLRAEAQAFRDKLCECIGKRMVARELALEEAAQACERIARPFEWGTQEAVQCARAIRSLKDKP